jgi:molybdopterin/thiamine biosynthesis adenylyltransferase
MTSLSEDRVYARHGRLRGAVLIIGTGAVGSLLAEELARAGITLLWLVDKDHFDVPNLPRHHLGALDLGRSKALALAKRIKQDFPLCRVAGMFADFLELTEAQQLYLVQQADVVVAATDSVECQRRINEVCLRARVTAVYPGVWVGAGVRDAEIGEIIWVPGDRDAPCYLCATTWRPEGRDAEARGGTRGDIQMTVLATLKVVRDLLTPQDDSARILDDDHPLLLVHGFMPPSETVAGLFDGLQLQHLQVEFPSARCPACGASRQNPTRQVPRARRVSHPNAFPLPPTSSSGRDLRRTPWARIIAAAVVLVVLSLIVALVLVQGDRQAATAPNGGSAVRITDPAKGSQPQQVPRVITVRGTGDSPRGRHLWIFVYAPGVARYYPQGEAASPKSRGWEVPGVTLGSASPDEVGKIFTIYALETDDAANAQISSSAGAEHDGGYSGEEWQRSFKHFSVDSTQVERV